MCLVCRPSIKRIAEHELCSEKSVYQPNVTFVYIEIHWRNDKRLLTGIVRITDIVLYRIEMESIRMVFWQYYHSLRLTCSQRWVLAKTIFLMFVFFHISHNNNVDSKSIKMWILCTKEFIKSTILRFHLYDTFMYHQTLWMRLCICI